MPGAATASPKPPKKHRLIGRTDRDRRNQNRNAETPTTVASATTRSFSSGTSTPKRYAARRRPRLRAEMRAETPPIVTSVTSGSDFSTASSVTVSSPSFSSSSSSPSRGARSRYRVRRRRSDARFRSARPPVSPPRRRVAVARIVFENRRGIDRRRVQHSAHGLAGKRAPRRLDHQFNSVRLRSFASSSSSGGHLAAGGGETDALRPARRVERGGEPRGEQGVHSERPVRVLRALEARAVVVSQNDASQVTRRASPSFSTEQKNFFLKKAGAATRATPSVCLDSGWSYVT